MLRNFERCLSGVLKSEGGFVDDPHDPGGATNKGVTLATYRRYVNKSATVDDLKHITSAQVASVYKKQYWDAVCGDDLPDGVDYAVFDFGVNSGPARAAKYLQTVVGATSDGKIGPETIAAAKAMDPVRVISLLCDRRLTFLENLSTWKYYGKGWADRIHTVREDAIAMAGKPVQTPKPVPAPTPAPTPEPQPTPSPVANKAAATGLLALIVALGTFWHQIADFFHHLWSLIP